jgi:hypothetical protein
LSSAAIPSSAAWPALAQVGALGQVLAEQAIGVLVGAPLPRAARVTELDLYAGINGELEVLSHLPTLIPGQRATQLLGQPQHRGGQRRPYLVRGPSLGERKQQHLAAVALDQGPDRAGPLAEDQVAFPMPRHRSVGRLGRPLADVESVAQLTSALGSRLARG